MQGWSERLGNWIWTKGPGGLGAQKKTENLRGSINIMKSTINNNTYVFICTFKNHNVLKF